MWFLFLYNTEFIFMSFDFKEFKILFLTLKTCVYKTTH